MTILDSAWENSHVWSNLDPIDEAQRPEKETQGAHTSSVCLCSKYEEMYGRILKSLNIVNLHRGMSKLKLKINVKSTAVAVYCRFCGSEWRI